VDSIGLFIEEWRPKTFDQLYLVEIGAMLIFGAIATLLSFVYIGKFDLFRVLRAIGSGATFPPSVLLIFYPVSQGVRSLFGTEALKIYLMIAGMYGVVMGLYALFKR
jgi:hypothetical protein